MLQLNLPAYSFNIRKTGEKYSIFDRLRKKFVPLTPEEWVRQNFIEFLIREKGFPANLMVNEHRVVINQLAKRCDTVVYNRLSDPVVIIEYKSPYTELSQCVFDQIAIYNLQLRVEYLIVSNGLRHIYCKLDREKKAYTFLHEIPPYNSLF